MLIGQITRLLERMHLETNRLRFFLSPPIYKNAEEYFVIGNK